MRSRRGGIEPAWCLVLFLVWCVAFALLDDGTDPQSAAALKEVRVGMPQRDVIRILGNPDVMFHDGPGAKSKLEQLRKDARLGKLTEGPVLVYYAIMGRWWDDVGDWPIYIAFDKQDRVMYVSTAPDEVLGLRRPTR